MISSRVGEVVGLATPSPEDASISDKFKVGFSFWTMIHNGILRLATWISVGITLAILGVLIFESGSFFSVVRLADFFGGLTWSALIEPRQFGVWPLVYGTLVIASGAIILACPLGVLVALYLTFYSHRWMFVGARFFIEILASVPSVVYGYLAITMVTPSLKMIFPSTEVFNALSAIIVLGLMIFPTVVVLSIHALQGVSHDIQNAAHSLGQSKQRTLLQIVLPAAIGGISSAVLLAFARAIGETMAVTLAAGATPRLTWNLLESVQTMTSFIVQVSLGDSPAGSIEYYSIFVIGLMLFLICSFINLGALKFKRALSDS